MTDRADLRQIENLNQRGGRKLSIVDLILDGTLAIERGCWRPLTWVCEVL